MKVLVITPTFPPMTSGGADFAFRLCERMVAAGAEVMVVTSRIPAVATSEGLRVCAEMDVVSWREIWRVLQHARRFRPDVVNIHFSGGIWRHHPMVSILPVWLKRMLGGVRVVTHIEFPEPLRFRAGWNRANILRAGVLSCCGRIGAEPGYGTLLTDSDRIIVLCDSHKDRIGALESGALGKSSMIPPPPSVVFSGEIVGTRRTSLRGEFGVGPMDTLLVYYGYIYPNKGIETLLCAFASVAKFRPDLQLLFVGGGNDIALKAAGRPDYVSELRGLGEKLGIATRLHWTGYFPTESPRPSELLRLSDVCVLPFDEGVSMHRSSYGVAVAHGLPVISTWAAVMEEQFRNGENVALCPPRDPRQLAAKIMEVLEDQDLRERLSAGSRAMAARYFNWDECTKRTLEVFSEITSE